MNNYQRCPFCDSTFVEKQESGSGYRNFDERIECKNCGVNTGWMEDPEKLWNMRPVDKTLAVIMYMLHPFLENSILLAKHEDKGSDHELVEAACDFIKRIKE